MKEGRGDSKEKKKRCSFKDHNEGASSRTLGPEPRSGIEQMSPRRMTGGDADQATRLPRKCFKTVMQLTVSRLNLDHRSYWPFKLRETKKVIPELKTLLIVCTRFNQDSRFLVVSVVPTWTSMFTPDCLVYYTTWTSMFTPDCMVYYTVLTSFSLTPWRSQTPYLKS